MNVIDSTITLHNKTDENYTYGEPYFIEVQKNDFWYKLRPKNELNFILIGYILKPDESKEIDIDWSYGYGKLPKGDYRIIKSVFSDNNEIYISGEFTIN